MSSSNNFRVGNFQKNASETLKQMSNVKEFSDVTLISEDKIMFQAHKVVLAATSPFFREIINIANHPLIYLWGVNSQFLASMLEVIYDGETKVDKDDCNSFIRLLKYYQVYENNINQETYDGKYSKTIKNTQICNFWNKGFCKEKYTCPFDHPKNDCIEHIKNGQCKDLRCKSRHRDICKYWKNGWCQREDQCQYLHSQINDKYESRRSKPRKCDNSRRHTSRSSVRPTGNRRRYESKSRNKSEINSRSRSECESESESEGESESESEDESEGEWDRESECESSIISYSESRRSNTKISLSTHCQHSSGSECVKCFDFGLLDLEESS